MKHIAYKRPDGGVNIVCPHPDVPLDDVMAKDVPPDATEVQVLDKLPSRAYRDAWVLSGGVVTHDMEKARELKMAEIRAERDKRLAATDGVYLRAQERGDDTEAAKLKEYRQGLRDLPAKVALDVETPEELKALQPDWPA